MSKIDGKASLGGSARRLGYTGAIFIYSLHTPVQGRTTLARRLGNMSAPLFGFVAFSRPPSLSSRHRASTKAVLEAGLSGVMLVEARQSLSEKFARQSRRLGYIGSR